MILLTTVHHRRLSISLAIILLVSLMGCSGMQTQHSARPDDWAQTQRSLQAIEQYQLSARLSVQTAEQGGSADMYWRQQSGGFTIQVNLPLGRGAMRLQGDEDRVTAQLADGRVISGHPDVLMREFFDVSVPVAALRYWLRGIALDGDYSQASWDDAGRLSRLQQAGWKLEISTYERYGDVFLPTRFYIENIEDANIAIRLLVNNWRIVG